MAYLGWPSLCLGAVDLESSRRFYEALGFVVLDEVPAKRVVLGFGGFRVTLMPFLDENLINLRGGDVVAARESLRREFPDLDCDAEDYKASDRGADADGRCCAVRDPDGNVVFLDTNSNESGPEYVSTRSVEILEGAIQELTAVGANPVVVESLRGARESLVA